MALPILRAALLVLALGAPRQDCTTQWHLALQIPATYPVCGAVSTVIYISPDREAVVAEKERIRLNGWEWNYTGPVGERDEGGVIAQGWSITEWCCPGWPEPCHQARTR